MNPGVGEQRGVRWLRALPAVLAVAAAGLLAIPAAASADTCEGATTEVSAANIPELERTLLCLTNVFRAENGLNALTMDANLRRAAHEHSADTGTYNLTSKSANPGLDPSDPADDGNPHYNPFVPGKLTPQDRADLAGYQGGVGENIAWSNFPVWTPNEMIEGWKASPGHRANLLYADYVTAGMGLALANGITGTQMFGIEDNGATDTAVDLLVTPECSGARGSLAAAEAKLKKARKKLKRADGEGERKRAKRALKKAKRKLTTAREAELAACSPSSY